MPLTAENRKDVFIIDDSLFDRSRSSKTELLAKVFDHCSMKYKRGFRMLTLGWSDGNSFIPVNHCLLSAADDKNLLCDAANYDGRSFAGKRDIEVFFKSCKSYLRLVKECRSLSYNALTAHVSIVFTRYMMLSVAQRRNEDDKTICELFFCLMDELDDITFSQSMRIIMMH